MQQEEILKRLKEPFTSEEIEWKIQATTQDKSRGMAVAYIDSRAIQRRLDEVVGAFNWQNNYAIWQDKSQICGLSIFNEERGEWVTKYDGAENTDYEPIKGGLSDAFKRAAIQWGIGRYLYELTGLWVDIEQKGKSWVIKDNQYAKIEAMYNKEVAKIFAAKRGNIPAADDSVSAGNKPDADNSESAGNKKAQPTPQQKSKPSADLSEYRVQSVKPSGKESQLLELLNSNDEVVSAYVRNSNDNLKVGAVLQDVDMVQKNSSFGPYNLINGYKIAG